MSYENSFVYSLRQKVGDMRLITAGVEVVPVNKKNQIKFVRSRDIEGWSIPGGHVELGDSWQSAALKELREEVGIIANVGDLKICAIVSGPGRVFSYNDGTTQSFTVCFLCRDWEKEISFSDSEEIIEAKWMDIEQARKNVTSKRELMMLDAYEKFIMTEEIQMVFEE
ncbi:NUDIX domain-containing protein [Candidatus Saccharibacteria bacterium]|nr:NUDIX domain-containing protein [Candidatus Saccharibacteria bacterium]